MYAILNLVSSRDNCESLYKFISTTNEDNTIGRLEFSTEEALDEGITELFNNKGYTKSNLVAVELKNFDINVTMTADTE